MQVAFLHCRYPPLAEHPRVLDSLPATQKIDLFEDVGLGCRVLFIPRPPRKRYGSLCPPQHDALQQRCCSDGLHVLRIPRLPSKADAVALPTPNHPVDGKNSPFAPTQYCLPFVPDYRLECMHLWQDLIPQIDSSEQQTSPYVSDLSRSNRVHRPSPLIPSSHHGDCLPNVLFLQALFDSYCP